MRLYTRKNAFITFSNSTKEDRLNILDSIIIEYKKRISELSTVITQEMGPLKLYLKAQVLLVRHFMQVRKILDRYNFQKKSILQLFKKSQ